MLYRRIDLDLNQARTDEEYSLPGGFIYFFITGINSESSYAANFGLAIKFNDRTADPLEINNRQFYKTPFYRFFLTNLASGSDYSGFCAQPKLHIIVGLDSENFSTGFLAEPKTDLIRDALSGSVLEYYNEADNTTVLMVQIPHGCYGLLDFFSICLDGPAVGRALFQHTTSGDVEISRFGYLSLNTAGAAGLSLCGNPNLLLLPGDKMKVTSSGVGNAARAYIKVQGLPIVY